MLDLRLPTGLFFAITGILLIAYGFFEPDQSAPLTGAHLNLCVGAVMAAFGVIMLLLARRGSKA